MIKEIINHTVINLNIDYNMQKNNSEEIMEELLKDNRIGGFFAKVPDILERKARDILDDYIVATRGEMIGYDYVNNTEFDEDSVEFTLYSKSGCGCCPDEYEACIEIPIDILFGDTQLQLDCISRKTKIRLEEERIQKEKEEAEKERLKKEKKESRERERLAELKEKYEG